MKFCLRFVLLLTSLVFMFMMTFSSCMIKETETGSYYLIDNQSSFELKYKPQSSGVINEIRVLSGETSEIDETVELGTDGRAPDEFFEIKAIDINEDVYLYRDSSGIEIKALQLNTIGILNWVETLKGRNGDGNLFNYTLSVTDEMIN